LEVNPALESAPELVNKDPYGEGWLIRIAPANVAELDELMTAEQYQAMLGA
jgi:glycine cleavage system H protein